MRSLSLREQQAAFGATTSAAAGFLSGYLGGYIYAKLADLPAGQVAKAFAIWSAAAGAICTFASIITIDTKYAGIVPKGLWVLIQSAAMYDLRIRGLMGDKLMVLWVAGIVLTATCYSFKSKGSDWMM